MLPIYWVLSILVTILSVCYLANFLLFIVTSVFVSVLAVCLALEANARDLTQLDHFKNNRLFDLAEEIRLICRDDFASTAYFNCLSSSASRSSPIQQMINKKQNCYQQRYASALSEYDSHDGEAYTGDAKIDEQINDLINLLLRDYVHSWYSSVSSNQEFVNELRLVLQTIVRLLVGRLSKIDKLRYITTKLVDNFVAHLKLYRMAKQHLKTNGIEITEESLQESFFNFELKSESNRFCRSAVSESTEFCLNYLAELTSILEYLILPPDLFNNRPVRFFVNSICVNSTFYPLLELLADPDFINQTLISLCRTRKLNIALSESFLIILRSSASKEELNAVLESVREEIALQRSKDTGGDDDFEIKQQLSSLCFVNSIIKERLKLLNEVGQEQIDAKINLQEENNNFNCQKNDLVSLNFDFVLSNPLALTYFFEYMITINKQSYLNFYLSVEGFRVSVEQKLVAIQMKESQELIRQSELECARNATDCDKENKDGETRPSDYANELSTIEEDDSRTEENRNSSVLSEKEIVQLNNELKELTNDDRPEVPDVEEEQKLIEKLEHEMQRKLRKLKEDNEKAVWLNNLIVRAREEARSIYDTYLSSTSSRQHRIQVDEWMEQDLKRKIDNEELSETWFDTIHQLVYRRLREEEQFFSSFKKSIHYYKLLKELGLLKNSSLRDKSQFVSQKNNGGSNGNNKSIFYLEVENDSSSVKSNDHSSNDTESLSSLLDRRSSSEQQETAGGHQVLKEETELTDKAVVKLDAEITSTGITREFGKEFGVYCINVTRRDYRNESTTDFKEEKWCVVRRYSDFYTFHQQTVKLFPQLGKLGLPPKKPFANMNQEFLEQRKQSLNSYLRQLLNLLNNLQTPEQQQHFHLDKFKLRDHILQFFESGNYLPKSRPNSNNQILAKTMSTVLNPFKSMKSKPGNLIEGISKIKPFGSNHQDKQQQAHQPSNAKPPPSSSSGSRLTPTSSNSNYLTPSFSSSSLSNLPYGQAGASPKHQPNLLNHLSNQLSTNSNQLNFDHNPDLVSAKLSETNIPLRILLLLMDEIFDLKSKSAWLRRRIFAVIKQIIQTTYGSTINRKIIGFINRLFSPSYIESYIKTLKKTLWPNGFRALPAPERDMNTKLRTKIATKILLLSIMPDDLGHVIGGETSRKSVMGLFNMLQSNVLNRRLVIVIFETFLVQLFPENELSAVFERLHSAGCKHADKLDQTNAAYPPYLHKMNLNSNMSSNSNSDQSSKTSPVYKYQS